MNAHQPSLEDVRSKAQAALKHTAQLIAALEECAMRANYMLLSDPTAPQPKFILEAARNAIALATEQDTPAEVEAIARIRRSMESDWRGVESDDI